MTRTPSLRHSHLNKKSVFSSLVRLTNPTSQFEQATHQNNYLPKIRINKIVYQKLTEIALAEGTSATAVANNLLLQQLMPSTVGVSK